ncbi:MAG: hypothetical protein QW728_02635 [Thermoplasmata archaeon]
MEAVFAPARSYNYFTAGLISLLVSFFCILIIYIVLGYNLFFTGASASMPIYYYAASDAFTRYTSYTFIVHALAGITVYSGCMAYSCAVLWAWAGRWNKEKAVREFLFLALAAVSIFFLTLLLQYKSGFSLSPAGLLLGLGVLHISHYSFVKVFGTDVNRVVVSRIMLSSASSAVFIAASGLLMLALKSQRFAKASVVVLIVVLIAILVFQSIEIYNSYTIARYISAEGEKGFPFDIFSEARKLGINIPQRSTVVATPAASSSFNIVPSWISGSSVPNPAGKDESVKEESSKTVVAYPLTGNKNHKENRVEIKSGVVWDEKKP